MIQIFRSRAAKAAAVVIFTLLMVIFLLTGVDWSAFGGSNNVGKIGGKSISARTYEALVNQQTEIAQQQSPGNLGLEDRTAIRNQVWDQLVQQSVLDAEYKKFGLTASDEEVASVLQASPPPQVLQSTQFQTDGKFDLAKYQRWLLAPTSAQYVEMLGAQAREQILRSKLLALATADIYLSDEALWEKWKDEHETVKIGLTAIVPRNVVPDSAVHITNDDVEAYFKAHTDEFKRGRIAYLSGIRLPRVISAADTAAALKRAQDLRQEIADGTPFEEVARRESADLASAEQGGNLGQWVKGQMDPAFDSAAFSLPLNTVSAPVLSSFGYHLIEITARHADTATGRHILVPIDLAGENRDRMDARLDTLDQYAVGKPDPSALDSVSRWLKLPIAHDLSVQPGGRVQMGNQVVPDAGIWAFQTAIGEIGDVIETPDAYYLFRLDSVRDESSPKLAQVRPAVEAEVRDQKRFEVARGIAENYLKRVAEGSTPKQAADALGITRGEFGPFTRVSPPLDIPEVIGAAFGIAPGKRSDIITTDVGVYVVDVLAHTPADSAEFVKQLDDYRLKSIQLARQSRIRNYLDALKQQAKVVDNRQKFLQRTAEQNARAQS
ncbi:MAG TPA: SurA N-terminal domain-containing protein [Gemmatimonadales bacterium]|nr:SurA N-terminal domain-containing protein [Gemmatimonadales bacterium]